MTPQAIFQMINQACHQERAAGYLREQMARKLPEMHGLVGLDGESPVDDLVQFVIEYIEMAPRLIESVEVCARKAGVKALFRPFIQTAQGYFASPSVLLARFAGLESLLIKAYQCHRLMEEMYENNRSFRNSHLVDLEATQANLLVHHLIGEPFANEIDQSILITVHQIAGSADYYDLNLAPFVDQAQDAAWDWMRQYWQQLLDRNGIHFHFAYRSAL